MHHIWTERRYWCGTGNYKWIKDKLISLVLTNWSNQEKKQEYLELDLPKPDHWLLHICQSHNYGSLHIFNLPYQELDKNLDRKMRILRHDHSQSRLLLYRQNNHSYLSWGDIWGSGNLDENCRLGNSGTEAMVDFSGKRRSGIAPPARIQSRRPPPRPSAAEPNTRHWAHQIKYRSSLSNQDGSNRRAGWEAQAGGH
jgi:hypothetical protein